MAINNIQKLPVSSLGYGFIEDAYLPVGKDEYYLRDIQERSGVNHRQLTAH